MDLPREQYKRITEFGGNYLLQSEDGFKIAECWYGNNCETVYNYQSDFNATFAGMVEMIHVNDHVDILYLSKAWKDETYFLNLIRLDRWRPDKVLYEIKEIPTRKPKRIEIFSSEDFFNKEELFVFQFEGENKAYSMPLCSFNEYLHEGKECRKCKDFHYNLDPQGNFCQSCLHFGEEIFMSKAYDHVINGVCLEDDKGGIKEWQEKEKQEADGYGPLFDFKSCNKNSRCIWFKVGINLLILICIAGISYAGYLLLSSNCEDGYECCNCYNCCKKKRLRSIRKAHLEEDDGVIFL